ncbi:ABC transporter ATP-binding protein [Nesterenkonia flava]|uniref:ABC transporter ATP-binding protein n=1 Tax=Nesterenkonia flava TaxID=469799 RepID=A0ABU1FSJ1_9MICC|nr:ABC transporter ATP-binding protein [Nesterenkonia flava]MDR5711578.1 ABC transporter ATP-binding protein [Nesterenkonia flava]
MAAIELSGLTRRFKDTTAVDAVDLTVEDGDFLVLLGPSGCGKSTLLRMLAGLLEPTAGTIRIGNADVTALSPRRRGIAMVFQNYALYPHLSVRQNLSFPLRFAKLTKEEKQQKVAAVAESLDIAALLDRKPKELSGGQCQRVAVGRALVRDPQAFLMDEPLSNLDASLRTSTRQELTSLHRQLGATFIYVTHDQVEAMTMATRIVVLNKGRIEQVGTPLDVYDAPASVFVAQFIGSPAMNLVPATVTSRDGTVHLVGEGISVPLWEGETEDLEVYLGVRPEHLRPLTPHESGSAQVRLGCQLTHTEHLGNEEILYGQVAGTEVRIRRPRTGQAHPGPSAPERSADLTFALEHLHLFDRKTGRRLVWLPELAPSTAAEGSHRQPVLPAAV